MRVVFTNRQTTQFETYLDHLLVHEIHVKPCFVKIFRTVLQIYERCVHRQTDNRIFYKVETYLDCLLMPEIYAISNFVKIVRVVLEIYERCVHELTDRQTHLFTRLRPIYIVFSCLKYIYSETCLK